MTLRLFTHDQLDQIHSASLEVLLRTGVRVHEATSRALLQDAGCELSDNTLVRIPKSVVEDALRCAPSRVVLCDRTGAQSIFLEAERTYFGTGSDLPNTLDLETGERRPSLLSDVRSSARLADALPNLDFVMSMALPSDVPARTADRHSFKAMVESTVKPLGVTSWDEVGLADILAMAETVAGGRQELALAPFLLAYLEPFSPLQHTEGVLRKLLLMADRGLPFVYSPGPMDGATSPMTTAGALVTTNAEILSGLVIAQLRRRGTPFVWGAGSGPMDMRTGAATYFSPEFLLHCMGMAELAHHYYGLPVWGFAGYSDSKRADMQAGIEAALSILWAALSGANLVHDVGYVESGMTCSNEMMVICDEVIGIARRLLQGIQITPETLALDTIHEVGPGGNFLMTEHTVRHCREAWYPRLFDRQVHPAWAKAGEPTASRSAREIARHTLATHEPPPLASGTLEALAAVTAEADRRHAG